MRFNLRPLANIQERILRAFSPNQEYVVIGYSVLKEYNECDIDDVPDLDYYLEWLERYPYLKEAVLEFHKQNYRLGLVPFVLPTSNSYEPFTGIIAKNKICKESIQVVERQITNELDEIGDIAYTLEHVIDSLNRGIQHMQYGAVMNPTRKQIKGRSLSYLDLRPMHFPSTLNPT